MDKAIRLSAPREADGPRPLMVGIAGDTGVGKTTFATGLAAALGAERCLLLGVDDYRRYDRAEHRGMPFSAVHPDGIHLDILEQHLQLLALGRPVLKPVYDRVTGTFGRTEYVAPRRFVVAEGLHLITTKLMRACFDVTVYLDPPDQVRIDWIMEREVRERRAAGADPLANLHDRNADAGTHIHPQRLTADVVVRFQPGPGPRAGAWSATILLRQPVPRRLDRLLAGAGDLLRLDIVRDADGTPVRCLRADPASIAVLPSRLTDEFTGGIPLPAGVGALADGGTNPALALAQLVLACLTTADLPQQVLPPVGLTPRPGP